VAEVLGPNRGPSSPACDPCGDHRAKIRVFQILRLTRSCPNLIKSRFWGPFDWRLWSMALECDSGEGVVACGGNTNTRLLAWLPATCSAAPGIDSSASCFLLPLSSLTRRRRDLPRPRLVRRLRYCPLKSEVRTGQLDRPLTQT
jgi:hypothetical protein